MKTKKLELSSEQINTVISLYKNGKYQEAIEKIKALNQIYPNVPLLYNLIGACFKELSQLESAAKMFDNATIIKPDYAEAHFNLAVVLNDLGKKEKSINSYQKAISIFPAYADAHNNLGNLLKDFGQLKESIESLEWAVAYNPNYAEAYYNLGNALNEYGRAKSAINAFEKAISIKSDYINAYFNLAIAYKEIGDKKSFLKNIEKVVKLKPDWGEPQIHLSRVKPYKKDDPKISEIKSFLSRDGLDIDDRIGLNFSLAHIYESFENLDEQFKFLNEANKLHKKKLGYTFDIDIQRFKFIKQVFNKKHVFIKKSAIENNKIKPIFILGMPRSGTSLVHQIIDSHPDVFGAGELNSLNKIVAPILNKIKDSHNDVLSSEDLSSIRHKYLKSIENFNVNEKVIIDKMPLNFRYVGFILNAIPEAKIIHMNRDAMATCWSIYKSFFNGNAYSYNQDDLGNYYGLYKDLMIYWNNLFPNKILDVNYEKLTISQEDETRKILNYCDLDWNDNCLNFHTNQTAMKTTSALQVRQKMYQGSSEAWKKYEAYLHPLINRLNSF